MVLLAYSDIDPNLGESFLFPHYVIRIYSDFNCKQQLVNNLKTEPEGIERVDLRNKTKLGRAGLHINIHRDEMFSLQFEKKKFFWPELILLP